jgi:ribosomal protein S18 acetylase RimI-like enzyme
MDISDYDEAYALWCATPGMGLSEADSRENIARYLLANPGQSFVCRCGGRIVGTILCGNDGRRGFIHHTAVDAGHRRRGIGAQLVERVLAAQRERGILKVHLMIFITNEEGQAFWRRMGFSLREDLSLMSRSLV